MRRSMRLCSPKEDTPGTLADARCWHVRPRFMLSWVVQAGTPLALVASRAARYRAGQGYLAAHARNGAVAVPIHSTMGEAQR